MKNSLILGINICFTWQNIGIANSFIWYVFTGGGTVVPGSDYAYSSAYSQYGAAAYGTYGYGGASSGLLSK